MKEVGCQPPWRRLNVVGLPLCNNLTQFTEYGNLASKLQTEMLRSEILETTGCKLPCTLMEYKVMEGVNTKKL